MADNKETRQVEIILNAQQANASIKEMAAGVGLMKNQLDKMAQDDPRREQLKKDFDELRTRVAAARTEVYGFVQTEEQLRQAEERLLQVNAQTIAQGQVQTASYREMKDAAGLLEQQLEELSSDDPGRQQLIADYQELKTRMAAAKQEFNETAQSAEQLRQQELELAEANRQLVATGQAGGASMNEMKAAAGLLEKQLNEISRDDPGRAALIRDYQLLQQRMEAAKDEVKTYVKTEEELRAETEALNAENQQVILNGQKVTASFNQMDKAAKTLEAQLKDLSADDPGRKKLLDDYHALQERIEGVKKEMGQAEEEASVFKQALAFAGVTVGAEMVIDGIKELGAEIINTTKEVADLRANINTLTGATGAELDGLTTSVLAVSRTFGKDFNEVLQAGNTLAKQMGVSQQEAMRLIQQGFLAGADAGGDFLDQVKEYAPQFKDAGYAAQDFIGHISMASTQGIFSDKGADVVKEFGLRIREQTKATGEAMQAAFGSDFTAKIFSGIKDGSLTVEQALQQVAKQMDETQIPANQLQTVIADVFGGPGEDAGIEYLKSLKNVGKSVDELVDKTNVYTQRQERLLASQTELAEAQNALTKEFEGGSTVLDTLTNQGLTLLYTLLASLGATFKELSEPISAIWRSFADLAEQMGWFSEGTLTAKSAGEMLGAVIHALIQPMRIGYLIMADLVKATVEWAKSSDNARGYLRLLASPVVALFDLLKNGPAYFAGFSAAAETAFGGIGRAWAKVKSGEFSGAKDEFARMGKNIGEAYRKAFDEASTKKTATSATTQAAGDDPTKRAQGGDGITDAERQKAAEKAQKERDKEYKARKAARDKADQEHLNDLKKFVKEEGGLLEERNALAGQVMQVELTRQGQVRQAAEDRIIESAKDRLNKLTGLESDYTDQVLTIQQERGEQLQALHARWAEEDEKNRQRAIDEQIKLNEAESQEQLAYYQLQLADKMLNEQGYNELVFQEKQAAKDRELALLKQKYGEETAEYKKLNAEKLKEQAAHNAKSQKIDSDAEKFKKGISKVEAALNSDNVKFLEESLGKQTVLYKAFQVARKLAAAARIQMDLVQEVQGYWKNSSEFGPAGVIWAGIQSGLAAVRAGMALSQLNGFAKGGATGDGMVVPRGGGMRQAMGMAMGLGVGSNGKLVDEQGLEVAGIVHKNEYVIPEWMREDPEVLQVENWLEARRQRGSFVNGGTTTEGDTRAAGGATSPEAASSQLVQVLTSLDQRLLSVEDWAKNLKVYNDLLDLNRELEKAKKVQNQSAVRATEK
jgi:acyl carrier protein phosphodiesterase